MPVRAPKGIVTMIAMITTCPACSTAFRVSQEQLAAREGRVCCGKCAMIFDARETLETEPPESVSENNALPGDRTAQASTAAFPEPGHVSAAPPGARDIGNASLEPSDASLTSAPPAGQLDGITPRKTDPVFTAAEPKRATYPARWVAASTLLALTLMAQFAFHYRGEIAILFPEIRPVLAELCTNLGCDVPLPRRAELISIESSDLQADPANPSVMVLTATLRNRAAFSQSHPSLELTLTDTQDQPLARRVLAVNDYLERSTSAETGFSGNSELPVKVYVEASSLKATGYRLYLFFP